jgi:hypothetical protein
MTMSMFHRKLSRTAIFTLLTLALGSSQAQAETPIQWRAAFGGEINEDPHGVLDLGVRQGDVSLELLTDTLDLRWQPYGDGWRAWLGGRAEGGAAGLLISPWQDGAPAPEAALLASYLGADAGALLALPAGFYAGPVGSARIYQFGSLSETTIAVPGPRAVISPEVIVGWSGPGMWGQVRAGADLQSVRRAPRIAGEFVVSPWWTLAPRLELRGGVARDQDFLTLTRLGGLNPYVVPLAGAAWAEFRTQSYAAARLGPVLQGESGRIALVVDAVVFDGRRELGTGAMGRFVHGDLFVEASIGFAPTVERRGDVPPVSAWLRAGLDWIDW